MKLCHQCQTLKPKREFYKHSGSRDGLASECKKCHKARHVKNKTHIVQQRKSFYEQNKDRLRSTSKKYRDDNKESINARRREQYPKHRDKYIARAARRIGTLAYREYQRWYKERRKALMAGLIHDLTKQEWDEILETFNHRCAYCLRPDKLEMDHLIPITKGGHTTKDNIVPACRSCNARKLDRTLIEWAHGLMLFPRSAYA